MTVNKVKDKAWLTEADRLLGLEPPRLTPEEEVLREQLRLAIRPRNEAIYAFSWKNAKPMLDASDGGAAVTRALLSNTATQVVGLSFAKLMKPDAVLPLLPDLLGIVLWDSEIEAGLSRRQILRLPRQILIEQITLLFPLLLDAADAVRCERLLRLCDELNKKLMEQVARAALQSSRAEIRQVAKGYLEQLAY